MEMLRRSPPGGSSQQKGTPDTAVQVAMAPPSEEPCSGCGFCREDVGTGDAAVALSLLPHWWRQLFGLNGDRDLLRRRVGSESWSALEHGAHVRDMLHAKASRLERIQDGDRPQIDDVVIDAPRAGDNDRDAEVVLHVLGRNSVRFVKLVVDMPPEAWWQTGRREGREVSALELVREAVHDGVHHLRGARAQLVLLGATPVRDDVGEDIWGRCPIAT